MKKLSALTLSLLLSLGAFSVMADDSAFDAIDTNGDGYIDQEEARNAGISDERFRELDTNGDGRLSKTEFKGQARGGDSWQ